MASPGRPPKEVNPDDVFRLASLYCTNQEIADWCGVSKDTIERRFRDEIERGRSMGRVSLRRKQFEMAQGGNVAMLIWLGKQLLGQYDKSASYIASQEQKQLQEQDAEAKASYDLLRTIMEDKIKRECQQNLLRPSSESQLQLSQPESPMDSSKVN